MESIRLNNFALQVIGPDGPVRKMSKGDDNYYAMPHGTEYKLCLTNSHGTNVDAHVWIDGEKVGVWRIYPHGKITIERQVGVARKFTILKEGLRETVLLKLI